MRSEEGPRQLCGKDCLFQHRVSRPSGAFLRLPQRGNAAGEDDPSPPGDLPHGICSAASLEFRLLLVPLAAMPILSATISANALL